LIKRLLTDADHRLGSGDKGVNQLMAHPFFKVALELLHAQHDDDDDDDACVGVFGCSTA
jgi:hypothetical protein